ncbi:MAG: BtpA/SgcQ family protein [Candidatus Sumerlaeaceae bacterium]|nr:BtpA/SgcQ family protein [Candidatus Sumerlaeaceae bacterium]
MNWTKKMLVGMIHVRALPGTPKSKLGVAEIVRLAAEEARVLAASGFDALIVENMHDLPYLKREVGPEITAAMTAVTGEIVSRVKIPVGVQILAGANKAALAVAKATGAGFIRAEGFVFAHVADEGLMESDAGGLLRYRRAIGADSIGVWADIKKKHSSHSITADVNLSETAHAAEFFGADALIVTGSATGKAARPEDLRETSNATRLPVLVGSGISGANLAEYWPLADGFIVGSSLKKNGRWDAPLDSQRISKFLKAAEKLRRAYGRR